MTTTPEFVSAEDIAVLYGVPVADVWAFAPPTQVPWFPPVEWLPQGRRRANEAMAHTSSTDFWLCIDYLRGVPMDQPTRTGQVTHLADHLPTTELLLPLRPELVGRATYVRRSRRTRATRWIKANGHAAAWGIAVCVVAAHVIATALVGGIQ